MNQIIGPKLSKSDIFYESLLTAFPSKDPAGEHKKGHGLRA
jgi:hypothetical protein